MKLKVCSSCGKECYLWKSKPPLCKSCALKNGTKIGNYSMTSNKAVRETKNVKPIPKVSQKQLERLKEYKKVKEEYFKEHPICEYPNCESRQISLHHAAGRVGDLLTDKRYFKSLCLQHHELCERMPHHAKELGLSLNRLDK